MIYLLPKYKRLRVQIQQEVTKISQKEKIIRIARVRTYLEGIIFGEYEFRGKRFLTSENVCICNNCVSHSFRIGVKFSRWGKKSPVGVKTHQVDTSQTVKSVTLGPALDIY